mgnify:CR=1 FL=1
MFGYIDVDKEITGNYGEDSCGEEVVACTCDECNEPYICRRQILRNRRYSCL